MHKARKRKTLVAQSRLWLMGFSTLILLILWVLQFALFTPFYHSLRLREIRDTGREVAQAYETQADFSYALRQVALNRNLRILLIDSSGWIIGNYDGFGTPFSVSGGRVSEKKIAQQLSSGQEASYIANDKDGARAVYLARVAPSPSGERYLYIASAIAPADASIRVMATQFVLITVILLLLSAVGSWLLSKRISQPIARLTESAKGLAKGEFQAEPQKEDYAEIVRLSAELTRATEEITKVERYRRELLANVTHDLKTPLTIIRFYAEMIRDFSFWGGGEKARQHSTKIIEESGRLTEMVNELLEVSKLEQTNEIAMEPLRLDVLLRETLERFDVLKSQGIQLAPSITDGITVMGQRDLLARAAYNLIANAMSFAGDDQRVWVRLLLKDDGKTARVEVTDAGPGIAPEELEHLWERYYKSTQSHRRGVAGSGLGLSIVQTALRLHNAHFGAESTLGSGSVFWFEMPVFSPEKAKKL
jgi:signal transduction histidine kinase